MEQYFLAGMRIWWRGRLRGHAGRQPPAYLHGKLYGWTHFYLLRRFLHHLLLLLLQRSERGRAGSKNKPAAEGHAVRRSRSARESPSCNSAGTTRKGSGGGKTGASAG